MPETITLKQKVELVEEKLASLHNRVDLGKLEITLFPKFQIFNKPQYHMETIKTYFYEKGKPYPKCYVGDGVTRLQKFYDVDAKTARLIYIAKLEELYERTKKSEEIQEKAKVLSQLAEKIERNVMRYPLPRYKVKCKSCGREFKTRYKDREICYWCFTSSKKNPKPKAKSKKPKSKPKTAKCKRCSAEIDVKYEYCETCKQVLTIRGELKGEIRT
jgi:hypothetical protein